MIFITGAHGAGQEQFCRGMTAAGADISFDQAAAGEFDTLLHVEELVLRLMRAGEEPQGFIQAALPAWKGKVITADEVGCGIVPMEKEMRRFRDEAGFCAQLLALEADEVFRMVCGISQKIK